MPKKRQTKRRVTKKPLVRVPRTLTIGGFPSTKMVKLRYVTEIALDPGSASFVVHQFTANGLFSPDLSGGHQPSNYDKWMAQYDHYTVIGSKMTAQYVPTGTINVIPGICGIMLSDNGTRVAGFASLSDLLEQPNNSRSSPLRVGYLTDTKPPKTVSTFSASKFFGKTKAVILGDDAYRGNALANPPDQSYYEVYVYSISGNNPGLSNFIITIDYIAVLSERKPTTFS